MIASTLLLLFAASLPDETDKRLSGLIKQGDRAAFKRFFDTYHEDLFRFLKSRNSSDALAEDLIQHAFLFIWEHRAQIDEGLSLKAYLFRIAYTRLLNAYRDSAKFDSQEISAHLADVTFNLPDQDVQNREIMIAIEKAVASLPEKRRLAFELCFLHEHTYKEAAQIMEVSIKTVENHMATAFKQLRELLKIYR